MNAYMLDEMTVIAMCMEASAGPSQLPPVDSRRFSKGNASQAPQRDREETAERHTTPCMQGTVIR